MVWMCVYCKRTDTELAYRLWLNKSMHIYHWKLNVQNLLLKSLIREQLLDSDSMNVQTFFHKAIVKSWHCYNDP